MTKSSPAGQGKSGGAGNKPEGDAGAKPRDNRSKTQSTGGYTDKRGGGGSAGSKK